MTKVKTILKEFCSAKDILAINRLGLLTKGDERESQPVPWRHRLQRAERKELVRSEMRMKLRQAGRVSGRDKVKAVTEAREPQHSRFGEHLIHINCKAWGASTKIDDPAKSLNSEHKRTQQSLDQEKQSFIRQSHCLTREPLIVVERPPSPKIRSRAKIMEMHRIDPEFIRLPNYMRPIQSQSRAPSTLTTIDVFTVETKKKKNLWEGATDEKEGPKFKATARPSARLSNHELRQLKVGYTLHKPTTETIAKQRMPPKSVKQKTLPRPKSTPGSLRSTSPIFMTETPTLPPTAASKSDGRPGLSKSVSFFANLGDPEERKTPKSFPFSDSHPKSGSKTLSKSAPSERRNTGKVLVVSKECSSLEKHGVRTKTKKINKPAGFKSDSNKTEEINSKERSAKSSKEGNVKGSRDGSVRNNSRVQNLSGNSNHSATRRPASFDDLASSSKGQTSTEKKKFLAVLLDE